MCIVHVSPILYVACIYIYTRMNIYHDFQDTAGVPTMLQNHLQYFPHYGQSNLRCPPKQVVFCWLDMIFLQLMANKITQKLVKAGFELAFITADFKKKQKKQFLAMRYGLMWEPP